MKQKKRVVLLSGPTASGKSELAIKLAQHFKGEIINADSMQIYKEISILTSKPGLNDKKNIKHHLYGFNSVRKKFSTGLWLDMTLKKIDNLWKNGHTPIIVGGTGLYFKALTDGLVKIPSIPINLRKNIRKMHKKIGQKKFYDRLIKLDPLAEKYLSPSDSQRSMRVYEVKKFTGRSIYEFMNETKSSFKQNVFKKLFINIPRELLHIKIEKRVENMFNKGAIKEVEKFLKIKVNRDLSANKIIGIREISDYLKDKLTLIQTKELIKQKTRQYAKRQFTWARGHMKSWEMIYSNDLNDLFRKAINKIS